MYPYNVRREIRRRNNAATPEPHTRTRTVIPYPSVSDVTPRVNHARRWFYFRFFFFVFLFSSRSLCILAAPPRRALGSRKPPEKCLQYTGAYRLTVSYVRSVSFERRDRLIPYFAASEKTQGLFETKLRKAALFVLKIADVH